MTYRTTSHLTAKSIFFFVNRLIREFCRLVLRRSSATNSATNAIQHTCALSPPPFPPKKSPNSSTFFSIIPKKSNESWLATFSFFSGCAGAPPPWLRLRKSAVSAGWLGGGGRCGGCGIGGAGREGGTLSACLGGALSAVTV